MVCMAEPSAQLPLSFPCALNVSASMVQHTYSGITGGPFPVGAQVSVQARERVQVRA